MTFAPPTAIRVSRHELALNRSIWFAQGAMFAFLAVATLLCAFLPLELAIEPTAMAAFAALLGLIALAVICSKPPAIGSVENHLAVGSIYVATGLGMLAYDPYGVASASASMFIGSLLVLRLVDRGEIVVHLLGATTCLMAPLLVLGATFESVVGMAAIVISVWVLTGCCLVVIEAIEAQGRELENLVLRDPLTGLGNQRVLGALLTTELERHARTRRPLSVIVIDLDDFKQLNDTLGHAAGDALLQRVAAELRAVARPQETVVRQGGDEFSVVLPNTGPEQADGAAALVREALGRAGISGCLGVASFPRDAVHDKVLLHVADGRLLEAKASRRSPAGVSRVPDARQVGRA